jgi:hypothetical protein
MLLWLFRSHLSTGFDVLTSMLLAISTALLLSGLTYTMYLALEPAVRRHFPQAIISWSRLLTGRVRDTLVGRDVLFGVTLGVLWIVVFKTSQFILWRMGAVPDLYNSDFLLGARRAFGAWLSQFPNLLLGTLEFFGIFLGAKALFKRDWLATIMVVAFFVGVRLPGTNHLVINGITLAIAYLILALIVYRFGLIALACAIYTADLVQSVSFTQDISSWYFGMTVFCVLTVIALATWGFYHSLAPTADEA